LLLDMVLTGPRSSASLSMLVFSRRSFTSTKIPLCRAVNVLYNK
jgi:hypothetical protein